MSALRSLLLALLLVAAACGAEEPAAAPTPTGAATEGTTPTTPPATAPEVTPDDGKAATMPPGELEATVTFLGPEGERVPFEVELARTPEERQLGLMHRTELAEATGMLFLFPGDSFGGFWMKNTLIPLQIAYIAEDGSIVDIMDMEPCTEDPCPTYEPEGAYRYALEVNAGALDEAGVGEDWQVELPDDLPDAT